MISIRLLFVLTLSVYQPQVYDDTTLHSASTYVKLFSLILEDADVSKNIKTCIPKFDSTSKLVFVLKTNETEKYFKEEFPDSNIVLCRNPFISLLYTCDTSGWVFLEPIKEKENFITINCRLLYAEPKYRDGRVVTATTYSILKATFKFKKKNDENWTLRRKRIHYYKHKETGAIHRHG